MKSTKIIVASIILALMLNIIMPLATVFAASEYKISFSATGDHTVVLDNGNLKIDGQIVTFEGPNESDISYIASQSGPQISVTGSTPGTLKFDAAGKFTLYNTQGHVKYNNGDSINNSAVFNVEDYDSGNTNPPAQTYTVNFGASHSYTIGTATVTATVANVTDYTNVTLQDNTVITLSDNYDPDTMEVAISCAGGFSTTLSVDNKTTKMANKTNNGGIPNETLTFVVRAKGSGNQGGSETANPSYQNINLEYNFTGTSGEVLINNKRGVDGEKASWTGTINNAGYTEPAQKNQITINTRLGDWKFSKVTINGQVYNFTDNSESHTIEVPGASTYTITATKDESLGKTTTLIWVNPDYTPKDAEDAEWIKEFTIGHGYAKAIAVYDKDNKIMNPNQYINTTVQPDGSKSDQYGVNNGFGWIKLLAGQKVVFEFVPEYGYQLTGITINGQPVTASTTMNRFEFTMPEGMNVHFAATFTKTDNIVKSGSSKVTGGTVDVKDYLPGGSAQLTVNDVNLTDEKKQEFTNAANGYTVSEFLNISLLNVYYKGKNDSDDVWSNEIEELDDYVTVSIQLEEGINAEDIVIVHNIHDGKDYEVIEIESYDPETRILTFKTRSFSNYAIATKGEVKKTSNPKTGDNIALYASLFMVASIGAIVTLKINKDRKVRK